MIDTDLKLSAQRALWGNIPRSLRSASIEAQNYKIIWKCIFDAEASDDDIELLDCAATEIIADFADQYKIEEIYEILPFPKKMIHLKNLIFLRHEE